MTGHCEIETLSAWLDDALDEREAAAVAAHVAACPACAAELADLRRVVEALRSFERVAPPPALAMEVDRRTAMLRPRSPAEGLAARRVQMQPSVGLLAVTVILLGLLGVLVQSPVVKPWRMVFWREVMGAPVAPPEGHVTRLAGRQVAWAGAEWRELGVAAEAGRTIAIGSPEWTALIGEDPRLAELQRIGVPLLLRHGGQVVRIEPAPGPPGPTPRREEPGVAPAATRPSPARPLS